VVIPGQLLCLNSLPHEARGRWPVFVSVAFISAALAIVAWQLLALLLALAPVPTLVGQMKWPLALLGMTCFLLFFRNLAHLASRRRRS
jgi:hypothetical protein